MKFGVVTFPGSNGDYDSYKAVAEALGEEVVYLWHKDHDLQDVDVVILPGGFAFGDYLRAGAIARFSPIMREVAAHAKRGAPVLGFCNGFQVLCESHLLPGALLRNAELRFVSDLVRVRVENATSMFTNAYERHQVLLLPVAHGEGRFTADEEVLDRLEDEGRVAFRYVNAAGEPDEECNFNGSMRSIAGVIGEGGNVLGMMPHPERACDPALGRADGRALFESLLARVSA